MVFKVHRIAGVATCIAALLLGFVDALSGVVSVTVRTDKSGGGGALFGAHITIAELDLHAYSDSTGHAVVRDVPPGWYLIEARSMGYATQSARVAVANDTTTISFDLTYTELLANSIVVSAERMPSTTSESPLAVSVVEGRGLDRLRAQSIAGTIESLPGLREFSGGPVASKPVIRGLTSQRVLVAQDGVRMGSQSWDEPQAPELTAFNVERIEVVRGPNSVMFGSDALGGVVNVIRPSVFSVAPNQIHGLLEVTGFSNNTSGAGALTVGATTETMGYRINVNGRAAGEYSAPSGTLPNGKQLQQQEVYNSGASELGASATGAIRGNWGTLQLDLSHFGQEIEITPEPGRKEIETDPITGKVDTLDASPIQENIHERAVLSANLLSDNTRFILSGGMQYNSRKEEGVNKEEEQEEEEENPEVHLDLYTATFDARAEVQDIATIGISVLHQRNQTLGRNAIIPNYAQFNLAGFAYREQPILLNLRAMGSIRYDYRTLDSKSNAELNTADTSIIYTAASGNAGLSWMPLEDFTLKGTIGTGWRAPVAAELFGNGQDEGEVRYKRGVATLQPERSVNVEVGARLASSFVQVDLAAYHNVISDYIGLQPTAEIVDGLPVYSYFQSQAQIQGIELSAQVQLSPSLSVGSAFDGLIGTNTDSNTPLPLMPANRIQYWVTYTYNGWNGVQNFTASIRPRSVLAQSRVAASEIATPAYTVIDVMVGGVIPVGNRGLRTDLVVQNVLNTGYADHLSRYKAYALNPGLNVALKFSVPIL